MAKKRFLFKTNLEFAKQILHWYLPTIFCQIGSLSVQLDHSIIRMVFNSMYIIQNLGLKHECLLSGVLFKINAKDLESKLCINIALVFTVGCTTVCWLLIRECNQSGFPIQKNTWMSMCSSEWTTYALKHEKHKKLFPFPMHISRF